MRLDINNIEYKLMRTLGSFDEAVGKKEVVEIDEKKYIDLLGEKYNLILEIMMLENYGMNKSKCKEILNAWMMSFKKNKINVSIRSAGVSFFLAWSLYKEFLEGKI